MEGQFTILFQVRDNCLSQSIGTKQTEKSPYCFLLDTTVYLYLLHGQVSVAKTSQLNVSKSLCASFLHLSLGEAHLNSFTTYEKKFYSFRTFKTLIYFSNVFSSSCVHKADRRGEFPQFSMHTR